MESMETILIFVGLFLLIAGTVLLVEERRNG